MFINWPLALMFPMPLFQLLDHSPVVENAVYAKYCLSPKRVGDAVMFGQSLIIAERYTAPSVAAIFSRIHYCAKRVREDLLPRYKKGDRIFVTQLEQRLLQQSFGVLDYLQHPDEATLNLLGESVSAHMGIAGRNYLLLTKGWMDITAYSLLASKHGKKSYVEKTEREGTLRLPLEGSALIPLTGYKQYSVLEQPISIDSFLHCSDADMRYIAFLVHASEPTSEQILPLEDVSLHICDAAAARTIQKAQNNLNYLSLALKRNQERAAGPPYGSALLIN